MTGTVNKYKPQSLLGEGCSFQRLFLAKIYPRKQKILFLFLSVVFNKRQDLGDVFFLFDTHNFLSIK